MFRNILRKLSSWLIPRPGLEIARTQGVGTWRLAEEYLGAAKTLQPPAPRVSFVSYFLYGHALELTFKAFLISQGSTDKRLRRISHDLRRALRAANRHQCFEQIAFNSKDRTIIVWLSSYYREKEFEYLVAGSKSFPAADEVRDLCERMHRGVKPLIWTAANAYIARGAA